NARACIHGFAASPHQVHLTNLSSKPSLLERCMPGRDRTLAESGEPQRDGRQECERSGDVKSKPVILEPVEDPPSNERPEYASRPSPSESHPDRIRPAALPMAPIVMANVAAAVPSPALRAKGTSWLMVIKPAVVPRQ